MPVVDTAPVNFLLINFVIYDSRVVLTGNFLVSIKASFALLIGTYTGMNQCYVILTLLP